MRRCLIIQIPCYNEAEQIANCLRSLPQNVPGYSHIETLVIDDGSEDDTVVKAREAGADHILSLGQHRGLAQAFYRGLVYAFTVLQADALVNFDADLQYLPSDIPRLVEPLANDEADYVLGERQFNRIAHWGRTKMILQKLGSRFVSVLCQYNFNDVTTGFRALNRQAGLRLSVLTQYTYTVETLFHAVSQNLRIHRITIQTRSTPTRKSRLIQSTFGYCRKAVKTALITVLRHRAFNFFLVLSGVTLVGACFMALLYFFDQAPLVISQSHAFALCRFFSVLTVNLLIGAIVSDNIYINRCLTDELRYEQRLRELERKALEASPQRALDLSRV